MAFFSRTNKVMRLNVSLNKTRFSDLLLNDEPSRSFRSSGTGLLSVPRVRTKHGEAAFSYYAPNIWNKQTTRNLQVSCNSYYF